MKRTSLTIIIALTLTGCHKEERNVASEDNSTLTDKGYSTSATLESAEDKEEPLRPILSTQEVPENLISSSAARIGTKDITRKFIRKADLKFLTQSVANTTYHIEHITQKVGGYVTTSNLISNIEYIDIVTTSPDSSLESTYYMVTNHMTLRVPCMALDTALKQISKYITYLDYRNITAEDVTLQLKSNIWKGQMYQEAGKRYSDAINQNDAKAKDVINAEDRRRIVHEQADQTRLANLQLQEQIQFSTIKLIIYQRQCVRTTAIANKNSAKAYEQSLGRRLWQALFWGWKLFEEIIIFMFKIWWLLLASFGAFILFRRYKSKKSIN
ncbi:MAG TPA: DUF4349 domain-containing protein [Cytophagales bacterium]|nr:DUF4349 domain-containing protein [Cytophagales bacterium]